jgi:hypothetical protein
MDEDSVLKTPAGETVKSSILLASAFGKLVKLVLMCR